MYAFVSPPALTQELIQAEEDKLDRLRLFGAKFASMAAAGKQRAVESHLNSNHDGGSNYLATNRTLGIFDVERETVLDELLTPGDSYGK